MARFPQIRIQIGADNSRLRRDMRTSSGIISKFSSAVKGALLGAAAAAAAFAADLAVDGVKAALEDAKAQRVLAKTLQNLTGATDQQIASVEEWISTQQLAYGISDTKLRKSLGTLTRYTKDVTKSQKLLNLAMDISAGTGKDLDQVVTALAKAAGGQNTALGRLGVGLDKTTLKTKSFSQIQEMLTKQFSGFASSEADTMEGKLRRLNERWGEMQEAVGVALMPAVEKLADWATSPEGAKALEDFGDAFSEALKVAADYLPDITDGLENITDNLDEIDWEKVFGGARFAMAVQFGMKVPGPWQVKLFAAAAAYFGYDIMTADDTPLSQREDIMGAVYGKGPLARKNNSVWDWANAAGVGTAAKPSVTVNINGAVDPQATARAISKLQNQGGRLGAMAAGRGIG